MLFHLQTVWEGFGANTPESGITEARRHGVRAPVGFDAHVDGQRLTEFMRRFGSGGTPWTIVIDRSGIVRMNQVTPPVDRLLKMVARIVKK